MKGLFPFVYQVFTPAGETAYLSGKSQQYPTAMHAELSQLTAEMEECRRVFKLPPDPKEKMKKVTVQELETRWIRC